GAARLLDSSAPGEEGDTIASEVETAARRIEELRLLVTALATHASDDRIVWIARERDGSASLNSAPLDVGPMLAEHLFEERKTVVATSATLSAAGDMRYSAGRLGLPEAETVQLGSPFDYERSTLLAAVDGLPAPDQRDYNSAAADAIAKLA